MADEFDYDAARDFLKKKADLRRQRSNQLYLKARKEADDIISMIKTEFRVKRIYQWGSLLSPERFDENSDIDIAIEGLHSVEDFFKLYGLAMEKTSFPLDLVEMEKVGELNRDSIRKNGKIVYER